MRVLLVEDDAHLGEAVREQIVADGHSVDWVQLLAAAGETFDAANYDLVLLDLMLPDGRGFDFLKRIRARGDTTPVVILSARDQVSERIAGLNAGADDYLVKPFDLSELSARIGAVARRYTGNPNPLMRIGPFEIDLAARQVWRSSKLVRLTAKEWAVFEILLRNPNAVVAKDHIEERLYSFDDEIGSNAIEVYVGRLRKKIGAEMIETVRGMGYKLGTPEAGS